MRFLLNRYLIFISFFYVMSANAFEINAEFSAEAVQSMPDRPPMIATMFVSKKAVRTESVMNGNTMTEIVFPSDKRRVLLNKQRKTFYEQKAPEGASNKKHSGDNSPCLVIANASCKKIGYEKVAGRDADKWEMTIVNNGHTAKSLHWVDSKHHMALREQFPDGTVTSMTLLGNEKINGRDTEKWEMNAAGPGGQSARSLQWYDPELKMVIREELPGGYIRELRNIKVAKQKKSLFEIPGDYVREAMPGMATGTGQ